MMMRRRKRETWVKSAWCVSKSYGHRASCSPDSPEAVSQASCRDAVRSTQCPEERPPEAGPLGSRNDKNATVELVVVLDLARPSASGDEVGRAQGQRFVDTAAGRPDVGAPRHDDLGLRRQTRRAREQDEEAPPRHVPVGLLAPPHVDDRDVVDRKARRGRDAPSPRHPWQRPLPPLVEREVGGARNVARARSRHSVEQLRLEAWAKWLQCEAASGEEGLRAMRNLSLPGSSGREPRNHGLASSRPLRRRRRC